MTIYSHSRLETYRNCPLKYKFQYLDKIKREEESIEAFLGSRFHEAMEVIYRKIRFEIISLNDLIAFYENNWERKFHDKVIITDDSRKAEDYKKLGKQFIKDYYHRYHPFNQTKILGVERIIMVNLDNNGRYRLRGFIDRLDRTDKGTYEIHDYKTSRSLPEQRKMDTDRQLALYQIAVQNMWNDVNEVELVWHYVAFDKEIRSSRSGQELADLKRETVDLIKKIENTREFLPNESVLCGWCYYKDICPLFKHEYKLRHLEKWKYLNDEGLKLVNEFAKLDSNKKTYAAKIKEIDEALEEMKIAVIEYAENLGLEVITGSNHQLKISSSEKYHVPGKGTEERKNLIKLLDKLDKLEELSTLDTPELKRALKEKRWESDILDKIKEFVELKKITSVHLSKNKEI